MVVYGFEPFHLSEEDDRSHGDDERLSLTDAIDDYTSGPAYAALASRRGCRCQGPRLSQQRPRPTYQRPRPDRATPAVVC